MPRTSARPRAVYRGAAVKTFASDLSNYSELRRGLSPVMRAHTLTKTELLKADAGTRERYIDALNQWRQLGQAEKKSIGRQMKTGQYRQPIEAIFDDALKTGVYTAGERVRIETAKLEILVRDPEEVEARLRESLNARDRLHGKDWYSAEYFLDSGTWDTEKASVGVMTEVLTTALNDKITDEQRDEIRSKFRALTGATEEETILGEISQRSAALIDVLAIAETF